VAQPIYLPQYKNPFLQAAPYLMGNLITQQLGQQFESKERAKQRRYEEAQQRKAMLFQLQDQGRDVVRTDAQKPPEGYTQLPGDTTTYVGPKPAPQIKPVQVGGQTLGYMMQDGGKSQFIKATSDTTAAIKNYNKELQDWKAGVGPNPGPFGPWLEGYQKRGATKINIGDKLALEEGKDRVSQKTEITSPNFQNKVISALKSKYGDVVWEQDLTQFQKEELILDEMDRQVREFYSDKSVVFGEKNGKEGWYDATTGKLLKPYEGHVPGSSKYRPRNQTNQRYLRPGPR